MNQQQNCSEEEHLERITHLYLQEQYIRKIENLHLCCNLIALYLYDNNIEKIENLDHLICLNCLYLHKNSITRIENLDMLSQLTVLNLGHNSISKVEGMESLCELRELYIQYQTLPEDQSLEFDPATVEWLGGTLRVLNVSGNRLQSFSALKLLENLENFTAEENDVWDLQELVNVFGHWKCAEVIKLTGNPVCNTKKYRDNVVVVCLELEELDGKVVPQAYRNFLLNWKQCLRLQDRKKESYAVLKPFLETQIKNKQLSPPRCARSSSVEAPIRSGSVSSSQSETSAGSSRSKSTQRSTSRTRSLQEVPMRLPVEKSCEVIFAIRNLFLFIYLRVKSCCSSYSDNTFNMKVLICCVVVISLYITLGNCAKDCAEERKRALESNKEGRIVPKCTENGEFQDLQCVRGTSNCTCYRPDGTRIMRPNSKVRSCHCIKHKDKLDTLEKDAGKKLHGAYHPQCEEDGTFKRKQCHGSAGTCWCVNEKGEKVDKKIEEC
ncbi:hypothetical protein JTE90_003985 [Oedothorax gibbosus]|uniref:Thyroglobulin type-1 domain-containing protein n=1 Tax=Oedothorax gibbosus TaxID=931172 RepID=A0AAV6UDA5_9ARAC|nr:hypothetical protein JTE90_003985 [Oedothorax gibbosus]